MPGQAEGWRPVSCNALLGSQPPTPPPPPQRDQTVDPKVEQHDQPRKAELDLAGESRRVDDREQVVVDEAARVARRPRKPPELVLERRERAEAPGELDGNAPGGGGEVKEAKPPPEKGEQATEKHKQDECEVGNDHEIGKNAISHVPPESGSGCLTDRALSCRPPVSVPGSIRRTPAESTPNRAAAGWKLWQTDPAAAGQLQCLVRQRLSIGVVAPSRSRRKPVRDAGLNDPIVDDECVGVSLVREALLVVR